MDMEPKIQVKYFIMNMEPKTPWYTTSNLLLLAFDTKLLVKVHVMPQFDWLCDVCGCVMSTTLGIYWVDLGFINNYKEFQLWLILLRYSADVASADVASAFPWVVTYGIRASPVILCGLRNTIPQSGP